MAEQLAGVGGFIATIRRPSIRYSPHALVAKVRGAAPELAAGIARVKSAKSMGVRMGNWLSLKQAQALLDAPDIMTTKGLRDRAIIAVLLGHASVQTTERSGRRTGRAAQGHGCTRVAVGWRGPAGAAGRPGGSAAGARLGHEERRSQRRRLTFWPLPVAN